VKSNSRAAARLPRPNTGDVAIADLEICKMRRKHERFGQNGIID
jgi:hypothetical protein